MLPSMPKGEIVGNLAKVDIGCCHLWQHIFFGKMALARDASALARVFQKLFPACVVSVHVCDGV